MARKAMIKDDFTQRRSERRAITLCASATLREVFLPRAPLVFVCGLAFAVAGCSAITVRSARPPDLLQAFRTSLLEDHEVSERTLQTFRQLDLEEAYQESPADAFRRLQQLTI